ncbi:MAG: ribosomal protein [Patescibacteria group bacterium]|jgi:ribosomal protein S6|nr:ribosomal protein [Patescibacteria group bacterium]
MREYEIFYLVGETKDAELPRIKTDVEALLALEGATFLDGETVDKRKLAYLIKKEVRGTYIARRFTVPQEEEALASELAKREETVDFIARVTKKLNLSKDVLRFLILRADDLPALAQIDRTEKPKAVAGGRRDGRDNRSNEGRDYRRTAAPRVASVKPEEKILTDAPKPEDEKKPVMSKEEMDQKLKDVLDI